MTYLVTGGHGFLGKYVIEELQAQGLGPIKSIGSEIDLRNRFNCDKILHGVKYVIHLAARVGGIGSNQMYPGSFFYDNMAMGINLIEASAQMGVRKFICVGSVCSYPKSPPVPFKESDLWNGYPEPTNAPYGIAKKALWTMLDAYYRQYGFRSVYPILTNLYGKGDKSDHVIPDMIKKFKQGKEQVVLWGSGEATREFLHAKDAARAIVMLMQVKDDPEPINVASGKEISIRDLAHMIARLTGFAGQIIWDDNQPNGQPKRCLDTTKIKKLGWFPTVKLEDGIGEMI